MTLPLLHILVVEDTPTDAELIQDILRPPQFDVTLVERLSDVPAVLRSTRVDVILLDLALHESRGPEMLRTVLEQAGGIAVVAITGNDDEQAAFDAIAQGAQDYLTKGTADAETIIRSVRHAFARGRTQEELRASNERFRGLVENCYDGIALVDREGSVLYSNPSIAGILGYTVEDFVASNHFTLIHPDDAMQARERFEDAINDRLQPSHRMDLRYRHRDGTWRYLEVVRANRIGDPANIVSFRDVTDRREAFEAADQLRRRYELILNSIADGVHGLGPTGEITFENAVSAAMLGWEASDLIGKPAHETIHHSHDGSPYDEEECPILATLADGVVRHVSDDVFWRKDGTSFHVDYVTAPQVDSEGQKRGIVIAFRDITRQREMQRQVDQAVRISSLGRVAASVAHEFNNVLMGIEPFVHILSRQVGDDSVLQKPLKHILAGVKRGRTVSHQILRFASPAEPRLARLNLDEWTRHFSEEARLVLHNQTLEVEAVESIIVQADSEQLSQVMLNLITNARDASAPGAVITIGADCAETISFLRQRLAEPRRFAALFVRDRGQGIPPEVLDHIFEPLFTTKKRGGTGLGLTVVQQIISEHGGTILVESEPGSGSTFYIALPLEEAAFDCPEGGGENFGM